MEMACQPSRRKEALLAAAHIRECDAGTTWLVRSCLNSVQSPSILRMQEWHAFAAWCLCQYGSIMVAFHVT